MVRIEMSIAITAAPGRVWRALCDPAEVVVWDSGVIKALDAPPDYPRPGQTVRWRLRSGWFRTLTDRPHAVEPERQLRSLLSFGPFHLDEIYSISATQSGCLLSLMLDARAALPLVGGLIERLYLRPAVQRDFCASLTALKRQCETVA